MRFTYSSTVAATRSRCCTGTATASASGTNGWKPSALPGPPQAQPRPPARSRPRSSNGCLKDSTCEHQNHTNPCISPLFLSTFWYNFGMFRRADTLSSNPDAHPATQAAWPDDLAALKALLRAQQQASAEREAQLLQRFDQRERQLQQAFAHREQQLQQAFDARVIELYEQILLARRRTFGRSSESNAGQGWLFDEADALLEAEPEASDVAPLPPACETTRPVKARGKRKPLPSELPRFDIRHELPEHERLCACCGKPMIEIGHAASEQLDLIPMQVRILRHLRVRYACPSGEHAPVSAPAPPQVLPKSNASNDLLAMLLTTKYVDGLPLARFEYVLARSGVQVPRQTLARWVIGSAHALQPIANLMRDALLAHDVMHMDETPVQVLKETDRAATSTSQMWVQRGGPADRPVILFEYDKSRSQNVPLRLLEGWQGYLMTDGLESYGAIGERDGVTRLGCWVHARRRFFEASKIQPAGTRGHAHHALKLIGQLYAPPRPLPRADRPPR